MAPFVVLSLNIWGLWLVSKRREERVKQLAEYLSKCQADVVCLQEVWVDSDAQVLINGAKSAGFRHCTHFRSGVFGSGLVTMSRHPFKEHAFWQYACAGFPMGISQGDYYAGKGVGWVRVTSPAGDVDVFNTHLHANYCHDYRVPLLRVQRLAGQEGAWAGAHAPTDEEAPIRIGQLLELTKVINLVAAAGQVPVVLAGDLNAVPDSLEMDLLRLRLPQLHDCWVVADKQLTNSSTSSSGGTTQEINPEGLTCKAPGNTFRPRRQVPERIDYVWSTLPCKQAQVLLQMSPAGCSYSDHFAVEATLDLAPSARPQSAGAEAVSSGSGASSVGKAAAGPMQLGRSGSPSKSPLPSSAAAAAAAAGSATGAGQTMSFDRQTATVVACASLLESGIQSFAGSYSGTLAVSGALLASLVYVCIGLPLAFPELQLAGPYLVMAALGLLGLTFLGVVGLLMAQIGDRSQKRALQNAYRQLHVYMVESGLRLVAPSDGSNPSMTAAAAAAPAAGSSP